MMLDSPTAQRFMTIALGHVTLEYPHKLDHVLLGDEDARTPRDLHPVFFGSFDWHSCVHGWWTLLTLRRLFPDLAPATAIAVLADDSFTEAKLDAEIAYLKRPLSAGFERPYGWGWLLYLHHEAARHHDRDWGRRIAPLATVFADRFKAYLPKLTYPITVGTHANTAFALILARAWAAERDSELVTLIDRWALAAFGGARDDRGWEPGGDEFLSPALTAALLIGEIEPRAAFTRWFEALLLDGGQIARFEPAFVSDRSDGKIAHLDGLNLSRAWCLSAIAAKIAPHPCVPALAAQAERHLAAALPHVAGDYMGEHWLASFALLACLGDLAPA
jgi:hypothetical protein